MAGSKNGPVIVPGDPEKSTFYTLTLLPSDDADVMPQKGDLLSKREIDTIKQWIKEGARFGNWKGNHTGPVVRTSKGNSDEKPSPLDAIAKGMTRPTSTQVATVTRKSKARVVAVSARNPLLDVSYPSGAREITNREMLELAPLSMYITRLDLSETGISDAGLKHFARARNLTHLNLSHTSITDAGLAHIRNAPHLGYLNLYDTQVSDRAIEHISRFKNLKSIYVWQSKITSAGIEKLKSRLPKAEIVGAGFLATPPQATPGGQDRGSGIRRNTPVSASKMEFSPGSCCAKAAKKGGKCSHPCCVRAARQNKICSRCNK